MIRKFFLAVLTAGALAFSFGARLPPRPPTTTAAGTIAITTGDMAAGGFSFTAASGTMGLATAISISRITMLPRCITTASTIPDFYHWTPERGYHSHGHYHITPHYTPGHWHY